MLATRHIFISFLLTACIANAESATPTAQPPVPDPLIELASGGLQRCWIVQTPWGLQRRCRGGWSGYGGYYSGPGGYGGYGGYGGGWSGGYGYPARGDWDGDGD